MDLVPIPTSDRPQLLAFLEAHLLGGEPLGNLDEELAAVSDQGLIALNAQVATFLGVEPANERPSSRQELLARLAELLDSVALAEEAMPAQERVTLARRHPDGSEPNDALRATSPVEMEILGQEKGAGRVTPATLSNMRHSVGWVSLEGFWKAHKEEGLTRKVAREAALRCREKKVAEYRSAQTSENAEQLVQKEYIAVTYHYGLARKRDPYDTGPPRQTNIELSPAACKDLEAAIAGHPSTIRRERHKKGWVSLTSLVTNGNTRSVSQAALLCKVRKWEALQTAGLSASEAEAFIMSDYMAIRRTPYSTQIRTDVSPEAARDIKAALREKGNIPPDRRKPGWWSLSAASDYLGCQWRVVKPQVETLREEKLQVYRTQGATEEEAERRVQDEYISHRHSLKHGQPFTNTDLSPTAFRDLSVRLLESGHARRLGNRRGGAGGGAPTIS